MLHVAIAAVLEGWDRRIEIASRDSERERDHHSLIGVVIAIVDRNRPSRS